MTQELINEHAFAIRNMQTGKNSILPNVTLSLVYDAVSNLPLYQTGKSAIVFKANDGEKNYAIKCYNSWHAVNPEHLQKVQKYLYDNKPDWIVPFELCENTLALRKFNNATTIPIIVMPWQAGQTLEVTIQQLCLAKNYASLQTIYEAFVQLAQKLLKQQAVHGDITPQNIMVSPNNDLVLVDHDTFSFDEETCRQSQFGWTPAYQHPSRRLSQHERYADHFSILSLAISLKALALSPTLYTAYNSKHGLLFSVADYKKLDSSQVWQALNALPNVHLHQLMILLEQSIKKNNCQIKDLLFALNPSPTITTTAAANIEFEALKHDNEILEKQLHAAKEETLQKLAALDKIRKENSKLKVNVEKKEAALAKQKLYKYIGISVAALAIVSFFYFTVAPLITEAPQVPLINTITTPATKADTTSTKKVAIVQTPNKTIKDRNDATTNTTTIVTTINIQQQPKPSNIEKDKQPKELPAKLINKNRSSSTLDEVITTDKKNEDTEKDMWAVPVKDKQVTPAAKQLSADPLDQKKKF
jgi:serine/threonine protein kinase